MDFLQSALKALPVVATSPYALIAYLSIVIAWSVIAWRVNRNKCLLQNLQKLPSKDRIRALQAEMGSVTVKGGLSPEQWIKTRIHRFYFLGFSLIILVLLVIFLVSAFSKQEGKATVDITPYQETGNSDSNLLGNMNSEIATANNELKSIDTEISVRNVSKAKPGRQNLFALRYTYDRRQDKVFIKPKMPYLTLLEDGGPVSSFEGRITSDDIPKLSVKFLNNTARTIYLTEAVINVNSSEINKEAILTVNGSRNAINFQNQGWGKAINSIINFGIAPVAFDTDPVEWCRNNSTRGAENNSVNVGTFDESKDLDISEYIPTELRPSNFGKLEGQSSYACVFGSMRYMTEGNKKRTLKFETVIQLGGYDQWPHISVNYVYDLFLPSEKYGYTVRMPMSQEIEPGKADHFLIKIATDKSCKFDLDFTFLAVDKTEVAANKVILEVFIPRSIAANVLATASGRRKSKRTTNKESELNQANHPPRSRNNRQQPVEDKVDPRDQP